MHTHQHQHNMYEKLTRNYMAKPEWQRAIASRIKNLIY
jgi:hypothetical protein